MRGANKGAFVDQPRPSGQVEHRPGQRLVQGHIGVAEANDALLAANGLGEGLAEDDADVLHGVVGVHLQVPLGLDAEVDQPVVGHLGEHVLKKRQPG